jgi:hypothetical protein
MNREYLEDYEQREKAEYERLLRRIQDGRFDFEKDRFPSDERFIKLQKPIAFAEFEAANIENLWAQVPFCGSLVVCLVAAPQLSFEKIYFKKTEIDKIVDFAKETGKLQFVLSQFPTEYQDLDYLEPFFLELQPPVFQSLPYFVFGTKKDVEKTVETFSTLAKIRFEDYLIKSVSVAKSVDPGFRLSAQAFLNRFLSIYCVLKLCGYQLAEEIENLLVDDPAKADHLLTVCRRFIYQPLNDMRCDITNFTSDVLYEARKLPLAYQPAQVRFPCEIGKFLMKDKLTYAPYGLEACKDIMNHYDAYDLQKVQASLNEAIITNGADLVFKSAKELSEILDNVWNDKAISHRIKNIEIGVPVSIAAVGGIVAGLPGLLAGGFLSELGFKVVEKATEKYAEKLFSVKGEGLTERLAKLRTKSYQANVYDFKKKYKGRINQPSSEEDKKTN